MFVQVIHGRVTSPEQVRAALDRWSGQLAAGAEGWLGSTAGVTGDGRFVALARFESEQAARRNSERPEQGAWWAETAKCFDGQATFLDCPQVVGQHLFQPLVPLCRVIRLGRHVSLPLLQQLPEPLKTSV